MNPYQPILLRTLEIQKVMDLDTYLSDPLESHVALSETLRSKINNLLGVNVPLASIRLTAKRLANGKVKLTAVEDLTLLLDALAENKKHATMDLTKA